MTDHFHQHANQILDDLTDYFESVEDDYGLDVDFVSETLTVTLASGLQYVINKHGVSRQIWLSSPFTGAYHYDYKEGQWTDTRNGHEIMSFIKDELASHAA